MRITNENQTPVPTTGNSADTPPTPRNDVAVSTSSSSASPSFPVSLVPSFEFLNLTATLNEVPPVRQEAIAETIRRLDAGQLDTPSALEQTARAILNL
jgi:hypothetical protein